MSATALSIPTTTLADGTSFPLLGLGTGHPKGGSYRVWRYQDIPGRIVGSGQVLKQLPGELI